MNHIEYILKTPRFSVIELCFLEHDACTENQCENGGTCIDTYHGYVCECPSTFIGKNCQFHKDSKLEKIISLKTDIRTSTNCCLGLDACFQNNCSENGSCRVNPDGNSYHCLCDVDYAGDRCEICKWSYFFLQSSSSGLIARNDLFCYKDWQFIVIVILSLIYWIVTRE